MDSTNSFSSTSVKKRIPVKILVYMWMAFLLPFIMYIPLNVFIGGLTFQECMYTSNNVYSYFFTVLALVVPVALYYWLNKAVKNMIRPMNLLWQN